MKKEDSQKNARSGKLAGSQATEDSLKVSVIIPAYNSSEFIVQTLDSALAQTFKGFEIIIVNDGSPDTEKLEKVLKPYSDKIIYIKHENKGAGAARNTAIDKARGEYLAFLDSDDIWFPEFLKSQMEFIEKNNFDLVYTDALLFGESSLDGKTFMETCPSNGVVKVKSLLDLSCNVLTSATLARKSAVLQAGKFEQEKVRAHDFVLWLKIARHGFQIGYQKKVLLKHRVRIESLSGDSIEQIQRAINVFKRIQNQIEFDESEWQIIRNQIERLNAEKELERGKSLLLQEKFDSALEAFMKANRHKKSKKLQVLIYLLRFFPKLILKTYRARRAKEIAFVPITKVK